MGGALLQGLRCHSSQCQVEVPQNQKRPSLHGHSCLLKMNNFVGTKDGQTKMVKDAKGKVELYSWEAATSLWKKVGDVVGSSGGSQASSGKTLFEGQVEN